MCFSRSWLQQRACIRSRSIQETSCRDGHLHTLPFFTHIVHTNILVAHDRQHEISYKHRYRSGLSTLQVANNHAYYKRILIIFTLVAGNSSASPASYCNGKSNKICYTWAVPSSTASSSSGNLFIRIQAPIEYQWVGLGTGDKMSGSTMFVIYQDGTGKVTLSTRMGHGHEMPEHSRMRSVRLIEGSGVVNNTMVANIHCGDLGNMRFKGSNHWISAWKAGSSLHTTDIDADIEEHDGHNSFSVDFSEAVVNSNSNPFIHMTTATPSGASSGGGGEGKTSTIHGIIMSVVFLLGYPLGSLLMPIIGKWFIHATWQMIVFIGMWAGFVAGKLAADRTGDVSSQACLLEVLTDF